MAGSACGVAEARASRERGDGRSRARGLASHE